jgi:hypothetical protein
MKCWGLCQELTDKGPLAALHGTLEFVQHHLMCGQTMILIFPRRGSETRGSGR